ncbi:MAG: DNA starvation/stationary phase protection protein [Ktedonobacteraceae bacterium]|nr:DNA starvation/stationary phase protection protein [Ktedonobacteraceae bacterium]
MTTVSKTQGKQAIKSFPAPAQLATPTDLKSEEVKAITEAVNRLVADSFALYVKTKNYHWHMSGSHFRDYHKLLDGQAESILASIDTLAERVRRIGGTTVRSITHISMLQTIPDDNDEFVPAGEMMRRLMEDNQHMAHAQREAHEICEKNRDVATASELEVIIDQTEKRTWFLFEVVKGMSNTE